MRLSKPFLVLFGIYLASIPLIYHWSSQRTATLPQKTQIQETSFYSARRALSSLPEGMGADGLFDCSLCEHKKIPPTELRFWLYVLFCLTLCGFAGLFSGMTVGYMGLDPLELEVKSVNGTEFEKLAAARIMPLLANHHLLLATLLLGNAICFETLPIFMDAIMPSWMAILISTTFILIFGEVVPQALCVGPQQLAIASGATPLVKVIIFIFMPVTYFIAKALDWFLGTHGERRYNRDMLIGIVGLHASKMKGHDQDPHSPKEMEDLHGDHHGGSEVLTPAEAKIIQSTIELRDVSVEEVMIKLHEMFAIEGSEQITKALLFKIAKRAYSKVPIYRGQKNNIVGIIPTKKFITADEYYNEPIDRSLTMVSPTFVAKDLNLLELLNVFQMGHTQIVFVTNRASSDATQQSPHKGFTFLETKYEVIGMVTLKDLFERLCKIELKDHDEHLYSVVNGKRKVSISRNIGHKHGFGHELGAPPHHGAYLTPSNDGPSLITKPLLSGNN